MWGDVIQLQHTNIFCFKDLNTLLTLVKYKDTDLETLVIFHLCSAFCWLDPHPPPTRTVGRREEWAWISENLWQLTETRKHRQTHTIRHMEEKRKSRTKMWFYKASLFITSKSLFWSHDNTMLCLCFDLQQQKRFTTLELRKTQCYNTLSLWAFYNSNTFPWQWESSESQTVTRKPPKHNPSRVKRDKA